MKFFPILLALPSVVLGISLTYNPAYDNHGGSLCSVACSDGDLGLLNRGFNRFGDLPNFPYIGGVPAIKSHGSSSCGSCWKVTYKGPYGKTTSINLLAVDVGGDGFNVARKAMDDLTGGRAQELGKIDVEAKMVQASACGFN